MKNWTNLLAGFDKRKEENPLESGQDSQFTSWLEEETHFQARPEFQAALRSRLMKRASLGVQPSPARRRTPLLLRLSSAGLGLAAMLVFGLALIGGVPASPLVTPTSVAVVPNFEVTIAPNDGKLNYIYDEVNQNYVNLEEAGKTLGFAPRLPDYVPPGYRLDNLALTYGEMARPETAEAEAKPNPAATLTVQPTGIAMNRPQGLQFQLSSAKASANGEVQAYQLQLPFGVNSNIRFIVMGAQRLNPQTVQGTPGYLVNGSRWRLIYFPMPTSIQGKPVLPFAFAATPRPSASVSSGNVSKSPAPVKGKPNFPPPGFKPEAKIAFGQGDEAKNSERFRPFIDFQPRADGQPARSLVWQKDGVVTVLVAADSVSDAELSRVAESFKVVGR